MNDMIKCICVGCIFYCIYLVNWKLVFFFIVILLFFYIVLGIRGCIFVVLCKFWIVLNVYLGYKYSLRLKVDFWVLNIFVK